MTRDEVLEMARQAGFFPIHFNRTELSAYPAGLERFAALVAERTRQEISKEEAKDRRDYLRAMSPG